jgi:enamine deaminase RidA (YjgF/YER057c/UK114 family)
MAGFTATKINLNKLCFFPETGSSFCEKLADCYRQFTESSLKNASSKNSIVKQTIFIATHSSSEYFQSKQKLSACATEFFGVLPPTTILAQTPENGSLAVEFVIVEGLKTNEVLHKQDEESSWLVIQRGASKIVIASGLGEEDAEAGNILFRSETAFRQLHHILTEEGMEFSDIIRQWNYIEQITETLDEHNSPSQHYQIFNDVRSKYYQLSDFKNGFPAATGIGMDFGGIIIDAIAARFEDENSIVAVKSPVQLDAYTYSKEVLAENNAMCDFCRTTPKFERAKILTPSEKKWILISGTAAISGQASDDQLSAEHQTEMTIQNILRLISVENIAKHGISSDEKASIQSLRVYVKYRKDLSNVKAVCIKYFSELPIIYVIADICRPELLVEIEGLAVLS